MCEFHQRLKREGKEIKVAPSPDLVLVKFNLRPKWAQRFEEAGIPRHFPWETDLEAKHIRQAKEFGREPYRFREIADSGVPVFGPEGVSDLSISDLLRELEQAGYKLQDVHIRTRQKKFDVLVIPFSREIPEGNLTLSEKASQLLKEFLEVCWGLGHIWANPPDDQGRIVHTLNLSHRKPEGIPRWRLRFEGGIWLREPA
jgi:hypothetical protein